MKFYIFTILIFISNSLKAQNTTKNVYFNLSPVDSEKFFCGDRAINCTLNSSISNETLVFNEDNQFYLEIANGNSSNYQKIFAKKLNLGIPGSAMFYLPDTLKTGKFYTIRMGSTSPSSISINTHIINYAIGLLPFNVEFKKDITFSKGYNTTYLGYKVNIEGIQNSRIGLNNEFYYFGESGSGSYTIKLSDGSIFTNQFNQPNIPNGLLVLNKDSINVYKIDEFTNSCNVKGKVDGDARVERRDNFYDIKIKNQGDFGYTCKNSKLTIEVNSIRLNSNSNLKLQYSKDIYFQTFESIDVKMNTDKNIIIDLPSSIIENTNYYFKLINENLAIQSNVLSLFIRSKFTSISPKLVQNSSDLIQISFNTNFGLNIDIFEANINGKKIESSQIILGALKFPFPKKDTTFKFSNVVTACGQSIIQNPTISIKLKDHVFFNLKSAQKDVCQGKTVEIKYISTNQLITNDVNFNVQVSISCTNLNSNSSEYRLIYLNSVIDQINNTIKVEIPKTLDDEIFKLFKTNNLLISKINLSVYPLSNGKNINLKVFSNDIEPIKINLSPRLTLVNPSISLEKIGYIDIPILYSGGGPINYKLSNNQIGSINPISNSCVNCQSESGNIVNIRVLAQKNETIKILSAENSCSLATIVGQTSINVDISKRSLYIDESRIQKNLCIDANSDIPLVKIGEWPSNSKNYLFAKIDGLKTSLAVFDNDKMQYKFPDFKSNNIEIWIESEGISSNSVEIKLNNKISNNYFNLSHGSKKPELIGNTITYYIPNSIGQYGCSFYANGGNNIFKINNINISGNYSYSNYYGVNFITNKDTSFTLNSISNSCGTIEINKTYIIKKVPTLLLENNSGLNIIYYNLCVGSNLEIKYKYEGLIPEKDLIIVQFSKRSRNEINKNLQPSVSNYFDLPSKTENGYVSYIIPDTLFGDYYYRLKSISNNIYSDENYFGSIIQKPIVKLKTTNNAAEVIGNPGGRLFLDSDLEKYGSLNIILSDGSFYSNYDFGLNSGYSYDTKTESYYLNSSNYGRYFSPLKTTTYSLKSVYNRCGEGQFSGTPTIKVPTFIEPQLENYKYTSTFCGGDSLILNLKYFGDFPKDTLMGLYLHNKVNVAFNQELITFKSNPKSLTIKLPKDINSGNYHLQIRKKSRAQIYIKNSYGQIDSNSLRVSKLNYDSDYIDINISTLPNLFLSGNSEIFVGNMAVLNVNQLNLKAESLSFANDTSVFIPGITYYYELSNGEKYANTQENIIVAPLKTETFSIKSIKSICGTGNPSGSATVTVFPKNENRIETLGIIQPRFNKPKPKLITREYSSLCSGTLDSLLIKIYGKNIKPDFSKYTVLLSDKEGSNYSPIRTNKWKIVEDSLTFKTISLWFELPLTLSKGKNYRIKGISDDNSVLSTPFKNPITILELPTASLTGRTQFIAGQKVNLPIKLTGDSPWLLRVVDKEEKVVYDGFPNKKDTIEDFKNYVPKIITNNELNLKINPEKSNSYRISHIFNASCEYGKVINSEYKVELLLANERQLNSDLISIYPNPTADLINMNLNNLKGNVVIKVFNLRGEELDNKVINNVENISNCSLDFSKYNSGTYILIIRNNGNSLSYKVIKY